MHRWTVTLNDWIAERWRTDAVLTTAGLAMLPVLALFLAGLWFDPRLITGAPAWLKPAKFALSTSIYMLTLAWIFQWLPGHDRLRRVISLGTAAIFSAEVAIIALQAWRGEASHFNISTPLNAVLFAAMGTAIVVQTFGAVALAIALWRQPFADAALGWALRLGLVLSIAGSTTGGLMTRPTAAQLEAARAGEKMLVAGGHTVGAVDGGPGLPGTGWSVEHGDIRVAHFVGLHALQALPIVALFLKRRLDAGRRLRATFAAAGLYGAAFGVLLVQALRGEPLVHPGTLTLSLAAAWLFGLAAVVVTLRRRHPQRFRAAVSI